MMHRRFHSSGRFGTASATAVLCCIALLSTTYAARADTVYPGAEWERIDPAVARWSKAGLRRAEAIAATLGTTAFMVVDGGRVVAAYGNLQRKIGVASVRKSFLSALYGIAVSEGKIDLSRTVQELGIDDTPPRLTPEEKQATVRQLLMARSGIYHPAAYETNRMSELRPERGSHPPGTYWYYNNWDFNALGTIYRQLTGEDIFGAVEARIARPLGMQDFSAADGKYIKTRLSDHPGYRMMFTARDLARFGWLYLNQGRWKERQVVPAAWVAESTKAHSHAQTHKNTAYGYMWWVAEANIHRTARVGPGAFSARGYGGQFILVAPAHNVVVVLVHAVRVTNPQEGRLLKAIMQAAPGNRGR